MIATLTITIAGLVIQGPAIVRFDVGTTIDQGFLSGAVAPAFGLPGPDSIGTIQEFGLWNYADVDVPPGTVVIIPPAAFRASLRWRLSVNGVMRTNPVGVVGWSNTDQNLDGAIDGIDYDLWHGWFESGDQRADFNGDGFVDGIDGDTFETEWSMK